MMRKCHLNTCPVGIATQDPQLRARFIGLPEHVINYFFLVAEEVRLLLAHLGFAHLSEVVGRSDLLEQRSLSEHWKARHLDLSPLLHRPKIPAHARTSAKKERPPSAGPAILSIMEKRLIAQCQAAIEGPDGVALELALHNSERTLGASLAGSIARQAGARGLENARISLKCRGYGGQSLGAFLTQGIQLQLVGVANDYVGKGLCGGRITILPFSRTKMDSSVSMPVLVGNTALYGATSGELFVAGRVGERFAVRNSGAVTVVEEVGDHACEYMTGGVAVILGSIGRNFAAGMSGGCAFIWDVEGKARQRINTDMVGYQIMGKQAAEDDRKLLKHWVSQHLVHTGSARARHILKHWEDEVQRFLLVHPLGRDVKQSTAAVVERGKYRVVKPIEIDTRPRRIIPYTVQARVQVFEPALS